MTPLPAILLVDDDEDHLMVARRAIERADLPADVCVAGAGDEALRVLGLHPPSAALLPPVKVVMLDLGLPDMSGWEVLKRIRASERTRRTPVVVVSSSSRPDDVRRSYELGANSYLVKRFDRGHPGGYLAEAARYWVELNESSRGPGRRDTSRPREGPRGRERVPRRRRADDASDRD